MTHPFSLLHLFFLFTFFFIGLCGVIGRAFLLLGLRTEFKRKLDLAVVTDTPYFLPIAKWPAMAVWPSFRLKSVRNRLSKNVSDNSAYSDDELPEIYHGVEEAHFFRLSEVF